MKSDIIKNVEQYIKKYDQLIIINEKQSNVMECVGKVCSKIPKKRLLLGTNIERQLPGIVCENLTKNELDTILDWYRVYEYTDKIRIIAGFDQYGSMKNYFETGIMTVDEYIKAILY